MSHHYRLYKVIGTGTRKTGGERLAPVSKSVAYGDKIAVLYRDGQKLYASFDGKIVFQSTPSSEHKAKALFSSMTSVPFVQLETTKNEGPQQVKAAIG